MDEAYSSSLFLQGIYFLYNMKSFIIVGASLLTARYYDMNYL